METFELDPTGNVIACNGPDNRPTLKFVRGKGGLVEKELQGNGKEIVYTYNERGKFIHARSVDFEQENFGSSRDAYSKLEFVDPDLADQFNILTGTGPDALQLARESELRRLVFWLE